MAVEIGCERYNEVVMLVSTHIFILFCNTFCNSLDEWWIISHNIKTPLSLSMLQIQFFSIDKLFKRTSQIWKEKRYNSSFEIMITRQETYIFLKFNTFAAGRIWPNSSCFQLTYQLHNSPSDCGRELFKPSKDSASLQVCNEKKFLVWGFRFFCEWCHK